MLRASLASKGTPPTTGNEAKHARLAQLNLVSAGLSGPLQTGHLSIAIVRSDSGIRTQGRPNGSWRPERSAACLPLQKRLW